MLQQCCAWNVFKDPEYPERCAHPVRGMLDLIHNMFAAGGAAGSSKNPRVSSWTGSSEHTSDIVPIHLDTNALRVSFEGAQGLMEDIHDLLQKPSRVSLQ